MNICSTCHIGRLSRRPTVYLEWYEKKWLVVNHMPAIVCDMCGDRTYDNEAMEHLQQLISSRPLPPPRTRPIIRKSQASKTKAGPAG